MHVIGTQIQKVNKSFGRFAASQEGVLDKTDEVIGGDKERHPVGDVPHKVVFKLKDDGVWILAQFLQRQGPLVFDLV